MSISFEKRHQEQAQLLALAQGFVERIRRDLGKITAWVYGSVARGDFNVWSDVDVFLVSEGLPLPPLDRFAFLFTYAPPGVEPKGYTAPEFRAALDKPNPQVIHALRDRILLVDELGLDAELAQALAVVPGP